MKPEIHVDDFVGNFVTADKFQLQNLLFELVSCCIFGMPSMT